MALADAHVTSHPATHCADAFVPVLQSDDPARDFRGAGLYGLDNLIYMGTHYPALFKQLMLKTQVSLHAQDNHCTCRVHAAGWISPWLP